MIEKLFLLKIFKKIPKFISHIYSLIFIILGWIIFACTSLSDILAYIKNMFLGSLSSPMTIYVLSTNIIILIIMCIASTPFPKIVAKKAASKLRLSDEMKFIFKASAAMIVFVLSIAYLTGDSYNPFLYYRF